MNRFKICTVNINTRERNRLKSIDLFTTLEEKEILADYLFKNENLSFTKLIEILNLKKDDVYVNKQILINTEIKPEFILLLANHKAASTILHRELREVEKILKTGYNYNRLKFWLYLKFYKMEGKKE